MVCRERAVAAPARHKFKIGQRQQGLGGPRYKAIWHDCMPWLDGEYARTDEWELR
jgi:hypothetical protein